MFNVLQLNEATVRGHLVNFLVTILHVDCIPATISKNEHSGLTGPYFKVYIK
jgi:hypothetical protein